MVALFRKQKKNYIVIAALTLFFTAVIMTYETLYGCIKKIFQKEISENFCYNHVGNELPYLDNKFSPGHHLIFFLETSCYGGLNSRKACAVEAAAKWNPVFTINVLFLSPIRNLSQKSLRTLKQYKNVNLYRINLDEYVKETPLEDFLKSGALNKTNYQVSHTSDFLRYLTLYKWGGIYLDLDTVVVRSLGDLELNWAARESEHAVGSSVLSMSRNLLGRYIAAATVSELAENWKGDDWGANGPGVIKRVLGQICATKMIKYMNAGSCQGFEIYPEKYFYPIAWWQSKQYFEPPTQNYSDAYVHHIWNRFSSKLDVRSDSLYAALAKENCPEIYKAYGDHFGL